MSSVAEPDSNRYCAQTEANSQTRPLQAHHAQDSASHDLLQQLLADQRCRWTTAEPLTTEHYLRQLVRPEPHIPWTLELAVGEYHSSRAAGKPVSVAALCQRFPQIVPELPARLYCDPQPPATARYVCRTFRSEDSHGTVWGGTDRQTSASVSIRYAISPPNTNVEPLLQKFETLKAHPCDNVIPILDCCTLPDGTLRLVTALVRGITLREHLQNRRPAPRDAIRILIGIASALEHLHSLELTHLALSPHCIILDPDSTTPLLNCAPLLPQTDYLSPEQAADEEHRADYRSDLFSFAVLCYELLTGVRPFRGRNVTELRRQIAIAKHVPARQVQPATPALIDQICNSSLQRSMSDRCLTATSIARLLREWLKDSSIRNTAANSLPIPTSLRPFDASSADTYPRLLPGTRDQTGMPISIAHWKSRIEQRTPQPGFRAALFSGPAGTGKTSFVAAGLLPQLSHQIITVFVDVARGMTEQRLLTALYEQQLINTKDPDTTHALDSDQLTNALKSIRRGNGPPVLLVFDHLEHWLLRQSDIADAPLTIALRQCDGHRLQALLIADSNASLSAARLMAALDIPLIQNQTHQAFELVTTEQAENLLTAFGRNSGKLAPEGQLSAEQQQFIQLAIQRLQQQTRVPQWQLALFMEQSRHLHWHPSALLSPTPLHSPLDFLLDCTFQSIQQQFPDAPTQLAAQRLIEALLPADQSPTPRPQRSQTELVQYVGTEIPHATIDQLLQILSSQACLLHSFPSFPPRPPLQHTEPAPAGTVDVKQTPQPAPDESENPDTDRHAEELPAEDPHDTRNQPTDNHSENSPTDNHAESHAKDVHADNQAPEHNLPDSEVNTPDLAPDSNPPLTAIAQPELPPIPDVAWQISHDLLIPPLQQWLINRKRNTRDGRAELQLADSLQLWNPRKPKQQLPSLTHWLQIVAFTDRRRWNEAQKLLLRHAEVLHVRRIVMLLAAALFVLFSATQGLRYYRASTLASSILTASPGQLPELLRKADRVGELIDEYLQPRIIESVTTDTSSTDKLADLTARLALLPRHPAHAEALARSFLSVDISTAAVIRDRLRNFAPTAISHWHETLLNPEKSEKRRFRAAVGLAGLTKPTAAEIWTPETLHFVALQLTSTFAEQQPQLRNLLSPLAPALLPHLQQLCIAPSAATQQKTSAAAAIAHYAPDSPELLTDLLLQATPEQAELLIPPLAALRHQPSIARLQNPSTPALNQTAAPATEIPSALLHANAALTLTATDQFAEAAAPLRISRQAQTVSLFATRAQQWNLSPGDLVLGLEFNERLRTLPGGNLPSNMANQATCSFLLALSQWNFNRMPANVRDTLSAYIRNLYENDPSAAVHSLTGWLLQHWGFHELRLAADAVDVPYDPRSDRQWFRLNIPMPTQNSTPGANLRNTAISLTFIIVPPGNYSIGSPPRTVNISTPFAVCDREVPQSVRLLWQQQNLKATTSDPDSTQIAVGTTDDPAAGNLSWIDGTQFCRWLTRQHRGNDESWQCFPNSLDSGIRLDRLGFRMPTGDEWEIAASRNGAAEFACGSDPLMLPFFSWTTANSSSPRTPASKPPTPNGLFDCHGNVSEWTVDAPAPGSRSHRGSSWQSAPEDSRLKTTFTSPETTVAPHIGLRIACTLPDARRRNTPSD